MYERVLRIVGPLHVVGGVLVFVTGFVPAAQRFFESLFLTIDGFVWSPFFVAILGPTIASWGVLFGTLVTQYFASPSVHLWRAMMIAVLIWAPLDTALCLKFGLYGGAIINGVVAVTLFVLLLGVRTLADEH